MAYFQYSLPKMYVVNDPAVATTGDSGDLTAGKIGLFDANSQVVVTTGNVASHPYVYFAQGSYYNTDSIGQSALNNLKRSDKTPYINAKYVTKFYTIKAQTPKNMVLQVGGITALNFYAEKTYQLRVELKGSPILRALMRNLYYHVPYYTGCAVDDCATCDKEYVDPASVMLGWADIINTNPMLSKFVTAQAGVRAAAPTTATLNSTTSVTVASGTGIAVGQVIVGAGIPAGATVTNVSGTTVTISTAATATASGVPVSFYTILNSSTYTPDANQTTPFTKVVSLIITASYIDTVFGDCSFNPVDFYQKEPIIIYASLVDDDGNPCNDEVKINSNTNTNTLEIQSPVTPEGVGESVIRAYMLSREYQMIHFSRDPRKRETEQDPIFSIVTRAKFYNLYYLQFNVPVHSNPGNIFSWNQYLLTFAFDTGTASTTFEALVSGWLAANNPAVSLQTII